MAKFHPRLEDTYPENSDAPVDRGTLRRRATSVRAGGTQMGPGRGPGVRGLGSAVSGATRIKGGTK